VVLINLTKDCGCVVMEYIPPQNRVLRNLLTNGEIVTTFGCQLGRFCADTLFNTSAIALSMTDLKSAVGFWSGNGDMCALITQVILVDPYISASTNRWTSPQLDGTVRAIKSNNRLKLAAAALKAKLLTCTQALVHSDLHTGSVMCCEGSVFVIDPEFAMYGPMGWDLGALLGNLFLSYFSQRGYGPERSEFAEFILDQVANLYKTFERRFVELWNRYLDDDTNVSGVTEGAAESKTAQTLFPSALILEHLDCKAQAQKDYMSDIFGDSIGFTGTILIARIIGLAHVEDMESIPDADTRSQCEKMALRFAEELILRYCCQQHSTVDHPDREYSNHRQGFQSIDEVVQLARSINSSDSLV
jgi:5-methylthioribose kinase